MRTTPRGRPRLCLTTRALPEFPDRRRGGVQGPRRPILVDRSCCLPRAPLCTSHRLGAPLCLGPRQISRGECGGRSGASRADNTLAADRSADRSELLNLPLRARGCRQNSYTSAQRDCRYASRCDRAVALPWRSHVPQGLHSPVVAHSTQLPSLPSCGRGWRRDSATSPVATHFSLRWQHFRQVGRFQANLAEHGYLGCVGPYR